jgi:hypothetical protein
MTYNDIIARIFALKLLLEAGVITPEGLLEARDLMFMAREHEARFAAMPTAGRA